MDCAAGITGLLSDGFRVSLSRFFVGMNSGYEHAHLKTRSVYP